ncbi:aarF domain-containing protein kinase 1-like [Mangifera indica]|uniref:aarF domain-containing protein kinase 1-like n=1 Tax=Mangifera indica TaxID=29780 RepID=UPI001CFBFA90|nr:aarF domain-containing protein kinase 1-like [Mangifera indica]
MWSVLFTQVCQTTEKELGKSIDDVFMDFVRTPSATASIAQVHRAKLIDGRDVVVKVQHPGIKTIILEDLKDVKYIVDWIAWPDPVYNFNPVLDEWCREAPKELDFKLEEVNSSDRLQCFPRCFNAGNFLVTKEAPHRPILLDFGLTKKLSNSVKQALAKFFLACAEQ